MLLAKDNPVVVLNGDTIADGNLSTLLACREERRAANPSYLVTAMVVSLFSPYSLIEMDSQGQITRFTERAVLPNWINIGVNVFDQEVIN